MKIINAQDTIRHLTMCINDECTDCPFDYQTACREYLLAEAIMALTAQGNELEKAIKRINELEEELASRPSTTKIISTLIINNKNISKGAPKLWETTNL